MTRERTGLVISGACLAVALLWWCNRPKCAKWVADDFLKGSLAENPEFAAEAGVEILAHDAYAVPSPDE